MSSPGSSSCVRGELERRVSVYVKTSLAQTPLHGCQAAKFQGCKIVRAAAYLGSPPVWCSSAREVTPVTHRKANA